MAIDVVLQVILAAELLKSAEELVKYKIHPTSIISGYRLACKYNFLSQFSVVCVYVCVSVCLCIHLSIG